MTASDRWIPGLLIGVIVIVAGVLVALSLDRPEPPSFPPTPVGPRPAGDTLVGPITYTLDARSPDDWTHFDFSSGSVVDGSTGAGWDLAFRRFNVMVNGGPGFVGRAGVADLGALPLDSVGRVPDDGYVGSDADSSAVVMERWYAYSWTSHLLTPLARTWAIRTADGRYAAIEMLSYYCPGAEPGCVTFRYRYQGDGSTSLISLPIDGPS